MVHRVDGKFDEDYYYENDRKVTDFKVWEELV